MIWNHSAPRLLRLHHPSCVTQLLPRRGSVVTVTPPPRSFDHETTKTTTAHHRYYIYYLQGSIYYIVTSIPFGSSTSSFEWTLIIIIIINRSVIVRRRVIAMDTGCACARQRVNRCTTRSHTEVIIVLRVRGGEWRASIARTNERPAEKAAAAAAEPLRASPALELYSYVMMIILLWSSSPPLTPSRLPSSDLLENPTRARRRFLFFICLFFC